MAATVKIPAEFTATDRWSKVIKKMTASIRNFSKQSISNIQRFDQKFSQTIKSMGRYNQMALGIGAAAMFTAGIQNNLAYNESLMSISSITGSVGKNLAILEDHAMNVAKATKTMGKDVLFGMEEIASAKPELLKTPKALADITKNAIILSKASKLDLASSASSLTTALNQFNLGANKSLMAIDALAAGSVFGASKIPQTADALAKFGTIAAATGTKLNESIALIQLVSPFEKGAEAGTKLRNILVKMSGIELMSNTKQKLLKNLGVDIGKVSNAALPLNERLLEMSKILKDKNAVISIFEAENAALGQAVLNNAGRFKEMLENVNQNGMAMAQATKNASSFAERIKAIKNNLLNVTTATNSNSTSMRILGNTMDWVANNAEIVVGVGGSMIGALVGIKAALIAAKVVTVGYNIALGVSAGLSNTAAISIGKNTVALGAYKVAQMATTAATWLATTASTAFAVAINAATWPILAIIAAIAAVVAIFYYWDDITAWFSKKWNQYTEWIGERWSKIINWFKEFDFRQFFKSIGQSILKFMLWPMQKILGLASKLPGKIGKMASATLERVKELGGSGEIGIKGPDPIPSPEQRRLQSDQEFKKSLLGGSLNINLNDPGKMVQSTEDNTTGIPIRLDKTVGAF